MDSPQGIAEAVYSVPYWRQRIQLADGIETPGRSTPDKWRRFHLGDISGKRVLDVGAWDGLHAFLAEQHGAGEVWAIDVYDQRGDYEGWWESIRGGAADAGIQLAKEVLQSGIQIRDMNLYDLTSDQHGTFDIVLFPAVLYHLKKPMEALEVMADVTGETLVVETMVAPPGSQLILNGSEGPPWWVPDLATLRKMLDLAGFEAMEIASADFMPFENNLVGIPPGTKVSGARETIRTGTWEVGRLLADGSKVPISDRDGEVYVELSKGEEPFQGWVDRSVAEPGWMGILRALGVVGGVKRGVMQAIRTGALGSVGRRLTGVNRWVVVHAHK